MFFCLFINSYFLFSAPKLYFQNLDTGMVYIPFNSGLMLFLSNPTFLSALSNPIFLVLNGDVPKYRPEIKWRIFRAGTSLIPHLYFDLVATAARSL